MFDEVEGRRRALYVVNSSGSKLLKLAIKSESRDRAFAQIKIIRYGIRRACVWVDRPNDPKIEELKGNVEITYHGGYQGGQLPKVHIKARSGYKNLVDDSLDLPADREVPVPLFSLEVGNASRRNTGNTVTKKAHVLSVSYTQPVRVDFYLAALNMDIGAFVDSMYFFNLLFTPDYLASARGGRLNGGLIIPPLVYFRMGEYKILARRSVSSHAKQPSLHFFKNKDYYAKFMGRRIAFPNEDGSFTWSTMVEHDEQIKKTSAFR